MTTTPRFFASFWKASVLGPGIRSARRKFRWSSFWQKYCERKSSWVQRIWAPSLAARSAAARQVARFSLGSAVQACWRRPSVTVRPFLIVLRLI